MTTQAPTNSLAVIKKEIVDVVQSTVTKYVNAGELHLPADYSPGNALKSAFLILQDVKNRDNKPALECCTKNSIQNALYNMVVQGLNPEKKQGYFIVYGTALTWQRSYFGSMALAKRLDPSIDDIPAEVIYEGDTLKYKIIKGRRQISDHEQEFKPGAARRIIGAYALVIDLRGEVVKTELMTIEQIHQSWRQSRQNPFESNGSLKAGSVHAKFPEDMCKRTVINKICKPIINSSDDSAILSQSIRQTLDESDTAAAELDYQANANQTFIDIEPVPAGVDKETGEITGQDQGPSSADVDAELAKEEAPY